VKEAKSSAIREAREPLVGLVQQVTKLIEPVITTEMIRVQSEKSLATPSFFDRSIWFYPFGKTKKSGATYCSIENDKAL
jgi:hypothetical protein